LTVLIFNKKIITLDSRVSVDSFVMKKDKFTDERVLTKLLHTKCCLHNHNHEASLTTSAIYLDH